MIEYIGSIGGIAGILAVVIFFIYRQDRKSSEDRLTNIINSYNDAVQENTKVLAELFTWLKARNGNK